MKEINMFLSLLFVFSVCHAQNQGRITSKEIRPRAGIENLYVYQAPKNLLISDKPEALVVYQSKRQFYSRSIPVNKVGNKYQFIFKAPDSTSVLIFGIIEARMNLADYNGLMEIKKKVFDNNNGAGFVFYLHDRKGKRFAYGNIILADLLHNYASYKLDVKTPNTFLIKMYEDTYKLYPV